MFWYSWQTIHTVADTELDAVRWQINVFEAYLDLILIAHLLCLCVILTA